MEHFPRRSDAESGSGVTGDGVPADAASAPITPLGLPKGCRGVVLFGGTFDPPHRWHMRGAMPLARSMRSCLVVVPAARNPLKATGPVASDADRVAMVRLALEAAAAEGEFHHGVRVWTDEIDRAGWARDRGTTMPSYMIDTVRRLRQIVDSRIKLHMIIGVDQALKFHQWREYRELFRLVPPLVMPRDDVASSKQFEELLRSTGAWDGWKICEWGSMFCEGRPLEPVSSTHIRDVLKRGEPTPDLDPSVRAYIDARGLYR